MYEKRFLCGVEGVRLVVGGTDGEELDGGVLDWEGSCKVVE